MNKKSVILLIILIISMPISFAYEEKIYVYGDNLIASKESNSQDINYYHQDYLSSNRVTTNNNREITGKNVQEPYGSEHEEKGNEESLSNSYKFTGKEEDNDKLYYYGARYYEPSSGRFISVDPVFDSSISPYAYANDNPMKYVDPTGAQNEEISGSDLGAWEEMRELYGHGSNFDENIFETNTGVNTGVGLAGVGVLAVPAGVSVPPLAIAIGCVGLGCAIVGILEGEIFKQPEKDKPYVPPSSDVMVEEIISEFETDRTTTERKIEKDPCEWYFCLSRKDVMHVLYDGGTVTTPIGSVGIPGRITQPVIVYRKMEEAYAIKAGVSKQPLKNLIALRLDKEAAARVVPRRDIVPDIGIILSLTIADWNVALPTAKRIQTPNSDISIGSQIRLIKFMGMP